MWFFLQTFAYQETLYKRFHKVLLGNFSLALNNMSTLAHPYFLHKVGSPNSEESIRINRKE